MAVVAAPKDGADVGKVHVYGKSGGSWAKTQELVASDAANQDFFGYSIDFDGQLAVVGAPGNAAYPTERAGVYVFERNGGSFAQQARLSIVGPPEIYFGSSVAVSGDTIVVGAPPGWDLMGNGQSVVFVRNGAVWDVQQTFTMPNEEHFGSPVCVQGDTAWVGARTGTARGVYVFKREGGVWTQTQKIDLPTTDYNTGVVGVSGGTLVIGFPGDGATGGAQVFRNPSEDLPVDTGDKQGSADESGSCSCTVPGRRGSLFGAAPLLVVSLALSFALLGVRRRRHASA